MKLYSSTQVAVSAFFGGPLAAIFVLKKNFDTLGDRAESRKMLIGGAIFILTLFVIISFLRLPHWVIPLTYTALAWEIAQNNQMTRVAKLNSTEYEFQSNWNVIGISVIFFFIFLFVLWLWVSGLTAVGVLKH